MQPSPLRAAIDALECVYSPERASAADWVRQVAQALALQPDFAEPDCALWRARYPSIFALGRTLTILR